MNLRGKIVQLGISVHGNKTASRQFLRNTISARTAKYVICRCNEFKCPPCSNAPRAFEHDFRCPPGHLNMISNAPLHVEMPPMKKCEKLVTVDYFENKNLHNGHWSAEDYYSFWFLAHSGHIWALFGEKCKQSLSILLACVHTNASKHSKTNESKHVR